MKALSPIEAIGPAWTRTRELLFDNFSLKRFLKLTSAGALALLGMISNWSFNTHQRGIQSHAGMVTFAAFTAAFGAVLFVIALLLFYFGSRMEFVVFEMVVTRNTTIGAMWKKYGRRTWRWIGLKAIIIIAMFAVLFSMLLPMIAANLHSHAKFTFHAFLAIFIPVTLVAMVFITLLYACWDFVLPVIGIEDASLLSSIGTAWRALSPSPGSLIAYLIMRLVIGIVFGIGVMLIWAIALLIAALPFGITGGAAYLLLHHAGIAGTIVMVLTFTVLGIAAFIYFILSYLAAAGMIAIFMQGYAVFYYGGRYQSLGDLLEPPPAPAAPLPFEPPLMGPFV